VRGFGIAWIVILCLSGCGLTTGPDGAFQTRYAKYVPGPPQPGNCGTPDRYKVCPPHPGPRAAVTRARAYVTIEEVPAMTAAPHRESLLQESPGPPEAR
jgi:hypothetical protein